MRYEKILLFLPVKENARFGLKLKKNRNISLSNKKRFQTKMMEFYVYLSKHRKVGHWFLKPLDEIFMFGNALYFPRYIEGDSLSGVWRQTKMGKGKHRPDTTIRYLDEEIKKAYTENQYHRAQFLSFLLHSWQHSFYYDKKFLHIREF